ncbi:MAG: dTMP kinase [Acidobacteria bacterium]|nr:dTMP kinase [Acidobacteriota bacterium]MBI3654806.1 dTMP kinase [Acidobacteriota bacterium]
MTTRGKFITFEGVEGSGKSTQLRLLETYLREKGIAVAVTREPGGTAFGRQLRRVLLDERGPARAPIAEMLLYLADRYQDLHEIIEPGLQAGKFILCDRYHDATVAYQGNGRGLDRALIADLAGRLAIRTPDLTLLFDLDVRIGLERALARNRQCVDSAGERRFDEEAVAFHERVREGYLEILKKEPERVRLIPAADSEEYIHKRVLAQIDPWL